MDEKQSNPAGLTSRFWDVTGGEIRIGGVNVREIPKETLMDTVSFVFQDSRLFKAYIFENVRMSRPNASRQEVERTLHEAQCDDAMSRAESIYPDRPGEIIVWLTAVCGEIMGMTVKPAGPERLFIQWIAKAILLERVLTNYAANRNISSRAVGENPDALAELFYTQKRPQAKGRGLHYALYHFRAADFQPAGTQGNPRNKL